MPLPITRREWLAASAAAALPLNAAEQPNKTFPVEPRARLAVATYPFRHLIGKRMSLGDFARTIPDKLQVNGIEPWSPHIHSLAPADIAALRKQMDAASVHVVNIAVDADARLCGSASDRAAGLAKYRKWVDAAAALGSPSIRVHLPSGEKPGSIECASSSLGELAQYGKSQNIVINLENDDPKNETAERIAAVVEKVDSSYLRALPDFCNTMLIRDDETFNHQALTRLFPLAYNISHAKDEEHDGAKVLRVSMKDIFAVAKKTNYRGYFSMEWEGVGDEYEGTRKLIASSLEYLS